MSIEKIIFPVTNAIEEEIFMSIRIGILGYGNLGKGVESAIAQNPDMAFYHHALCKCPQRNETE